MTIDASYRENNLLTRQQVASIFGICEQTVSNLVRTGMLPRPVKYSQRVYFPKEEIHRLAKDGMRP